jgi:hypothetical protein
LLFNNWPIMINNLIHPNEEILGLLYGRMVLGGLESYLLR